MRRIQISSKLFSIMTQTDFYADCVASNGIYKYFKDGHWVESGSGKTVAILNPTTNVAAFQVQGKYVLYAEQKLLVGMTSLYGNLWPFVKHRGDNGRAELIARSALDTFIL